MNPNTFVNPQYLLTSAFESDEAKRYIKNDPER